MALNKDNIKKTNGHLIMMIAYNYDMFVELLLLYFGQ